MMCPSRRKPLSACCTPPGREKLMHRLLLRSRVYYVLRFIAVVLGYWNIARTGRLDARTMRSSSASGFCVG